MQKLAGNRYGKKRYPLISGAAAGAAPRFSFRKIAKKAKLRNEKLTAQDDRAGAL